MAAGLIDRLFLAHPRSAGQGYFEHMRFAWSFAATLARYHALALGGVLLTSIHLDVMRFRFLWIALAVGMAAASCARQEVA